MQNGNKIVLVSISLLSLVIPMRPEADTYVYVRSSAIWVTPATLDQWITALDEARDYNGHLQL